MKQHNITYDYYTGDLYIIVTNDINTCGKLDSKYSIDHDFPGKCFLNILWSHMMSCDLYPVDNDNGNDNIYSTDLYKREYHCCSNLYLIFKNYKKQIADIDKELFNIQTPEKITSKIPGCSDQHAETGVLRSKCINCFKK